MKRVLVFLLIIIFFLLVTLAVSKSTKSPKKPSQTPTPASAMQELSDGSLERAILQAVSARRESVLGYMVNRIEVANFRYSEDTAWATAWLGFIDEDTGEALPTEPGLAIARREGENWNVFLPSDPRWKDALRQLPTSLMPEEEKATWLEDFHQAQQLMPTAPLSGYLLPWAKGELRYLSQSVGHDAYTPSGSMHFAFDFYVHEALWKIYASKAGKVWKFKFDVPTCIPVHCDDQPLGNYIVLKDSTTNPVSYQLYLHLAYNSIPPDLRYIGAPVAQGQLIGIADNTGQSWGDHLHFQVHTNPNSYFGTAVDITFGDVKINGGRPRVYAYDKDYCLPSDVCSSFRSSYYSYNTVKGDVTPPDGDITSPAGGSTISSSVLSLGAWAKDSQSGLFSAQLEALYNGAWHDIGPAFPTSPLAYSWDWCSSYVPDGPVSVALRLMDKEGNQVQFTGMKPFIKDYPCPQNPAPACQPNANQVSLYSEPDFSGTCQVFASGVYTNSTAMGAMNNNMDSIQVGSNVMATLFRDKNFGGGGDSFLTDDADLSNNRLGADKVSSMMVELRSSAPAAPNLVWPPDSYTFTSTHGLSLDWDYPWAVTQFQARLTVLGTSSTITTSWQSAPFWRLSSLAPGSYLWQVRDAAHPNQWSETHSLNIVAAPPASMLTHTAPYSYDFESGASGWTATSLWHIVTDSQQAHGGSKLWRFGETVSGNERYLSDKIGDLTSPSIQIPASLSNPTMRFYYRYQTETQDKTWDQRWVQISVDGGTFGDVLQLSDDPMDIWLRSVAVDLSSYSGHTIRVRFHFDSMDLAFNNYAGWYIDDVSIASETLQSCSGLDNQEPNDTPDQAYLISYGTTIDTAGICSNGDLDYFKFSGSAGDRVVVDVDAQSIGSELDAYVFLLKDDGSSVLAQNDDEKPTIIFDPHLGYQLPATGTYYIKLRAWDNPSAGGSRDFYRLRLIRDQNDPQAAITSPVSGQPMTAAPFTIATSVSDPDSGVSRVEFYWHSGDWQNENWTLLGADTDGSDGWSWAYDPAGLAIQSQMAIYIRVYDWAGNSTATAVWNLDNRPYHIFLGLIGR